MRGFTLSSGIGNIPNIERFLAISHLSRNPVSLSTSNCAGVYSWGSKPYSVHSGKIAKTFGLPHIRVEDGFVCSFGNSATRLKYSLVVDHIGIYYDATQPSRLENILNDQDADSWKLTNADYIERAQRLISALVRGEVGKYNSLSRTPVDFTEEDDYALVIDQTVGDQSVRLGGMDAERFSAMLHDAVSKYTREKVFVKVHPEVMAGRKQGYLSELAKSLGVQTISGDVSTAKLSGCKEVYVGTSLYGMEALLRDVPVVCYGQPFYANWGVTRDMQGMSRRAAGRSVTELFIAAYLIYATYLDPVTGKPCELEDIIEHIAVQSRQRKRIGGQVTCIGITPWKRKYIDKYLMRGDYKHCHVGAKKILPNAETPEKTRYLVWGKKSLESPLEQKLALRPVTRMEDGFVRSVGLGSNFTAPRSLVIDDLGIYFDATQVSRLEHMLENHEVTVAQTSRAQQLIDLLVAQRISKYVSAASQTAETSFYTGKKVLLVIGQVEGDASLKFGTHEIRSNLELLKAVKERNPERVIVYKPHPDVVSRNRSDGIENYSQISMLCDRVETGLSIDIALEHCEEIHTMTSLAGLEALLCGKKVVTYGMPFYAGWGLTKDICSFERRSRVRTLQELVYISYIDYPAYLDITSGEFTSVEKTISALIDERKAVSSSLTATGLKKYVNIIHNIRKGLTYAA